MRSENTGKSHAPAAAIEQPTRRMGWFRRLLEKIAKANDRDFGGSPPNCH